LQAGDAFQIFSAPSYLGTFTVTNLPSLGNYLYWTNSLHVNGRISVASAISLIATNLSWSVTGTSLSLSWPADHTGWRLVMQTNNLNNGVSANTNDWSTVANSQQTNQIIVPANSTLPMEFYRLIYP